jgi:polysaccharide deacetylase 2 family uncharacterized protein YibQ
MKSKKPRRSTVFRWLAAVVVLASLWLFLSPAMTPPQKSVPVHSRVERASPFLPPPSMSAPPAPTMAEPPFVGDERRQSQPNGVQVPVVSEPALPSGGGKNAVIAIIIDDVGLDMRGSQRAINLPPYVTLSFIPYAMRLREQTKEARDHGHELLLHMPMEPIGPDDPGPGALLVHLAPDEIRLRFQAALASFVGFDGVNNHMGSKFTADPSGMEIIIDEMQQRHLFFLDSRTSPNSVGEALAKEHGLPSASRDVFLDDEETLKAINVQLNQTERLAWRKGYAIAIGHPHAVTMQALENWLPGAEARGVKFVPVHALIRSPAAP